eukprot:1933702-Lingulodinium_polyedra.AAC.1
MGWLSAVGVMQHVARNLMLWPPPKGAGLSPALEVRRDREFPRQGVSAEEALWSAYLDDATYFNAVAPLDASA